LSKRHFTKAATQAQIFDPETAVDVGFLDRTTTPEELFDSALADATRLASLPHPAFRNTKQRERNATSRVIRDTLAADVAAITGFRPGG